MGNQAAQRYLLGGGAGGALLQATCALDKFDFKGIFDDVKIPIVVVNAHFLKIKYTVLLLMLLF